MQQKNSSSRRYSLDGFVPRESNRPRRRAAMDGSARRAGSGAGSRPQPRPIKPSATPVDWGSGAAVGSLSQPLDIEDLPEPAQQPRWWQWRQKRRQEQPTAPHSRRKTIKRIILAVLLLGLLLFGFIGWKFLHTTGKVFNGNVLGFFTTTKLKGEDVGRVNILLAGTSEDDGPEHGGATLTDSIMLLSINTKTNKAFTTSIPRDLYVKYGRACNSGYAGKINEVYNCGEDTDFDDGGYPSGGMGMLAKVVNDNFGVATQYYGKIDYTAFKQAVNAVGGVSVTIDSPDPRGIYDYNQGSLKLKNGVHQLDGDTALRLARARGSMGSYGLGRGDFDRTQYQRQMLLSLKDKVISANVLANPAKIGSLLDAAGNNVATNFKTSELRRLYDLSKKIKSQDTSSIDLAAEDINLVKTGSYNGASIVLPTAGLNNFSAIKQYFKKLTSNDPIVQEGAKIVVLNGSGEVGLAQKQADLLADKGLEISKVGNASANRTSTVIIDKSANRKKSTKKLLESQFGVVSTTDVVANPEAKSYEADFIVIISKQLGTAGSNQ